MWKVSFKTKEIKSWLDSNLELGFIKYEKPIILPTTPFDIEITLPVYDKLTNIYVSNEEKGGIIFCKIIKLQNGFKLQTTDVKEVLNIYETSADDPNGSKANRYRPDSMMYLRFLSENFSPSNSEEILFPIHFHTHPTADDKEFIAYSNSYYQLNTSDGDKNAALHRFVEFGQVKLRYLNAIITGHDGDYKIIFYAPSVTPLDFFSTKLTRIQTKLSNFGEEASALTDDQNKKKLVKAGIELLGNLFVGFNMATIDYIPLMFEEKEYFGYLEKDSSTTITIPEYKEDGTSKE